MLKCIAFILFMTPMYVSEAKATKADPIFEQVLKNHPGIDRKYARDIAKAIQKVAIEFGIKPQRLAAILAQESMYTLNAVNKKSKDYGIAQINHKTIESFGFDKKRLLTDLEYSVKAGAIVLADFKRMYGHKEKDYWTRYNSSKPERRAEYKQLVARYL